jgi:transcriptional regulator with XRE-family HTH domain
MSRREPLPGWRERLRRSVRASGKTQGRIADDAGVAIETVNRVLSGYHKRPELDTVVRIAYAAGENVGWVLGESGFAFSAEEMCDMRRLLEVVGRAASRAVAPQRDARALPNAAEVAGEAVASVGKRDLSRTLRFRALGETMEGAGIQHGDILFVAPNRDVRAAAGRTAVVRLNGSLYVKELRIDRGTIVLVSAHEGYGPIEIHEEQDDLVVIGAVVGRWGPPKPIGRD